MALASTRTRSSTRWEPRRWPGARASRSGDEHFGFGPLFPALLAVIIRLTGSVDAAYEWFKVANAFCFALTAVPVYLLARRLASAWWAVLAAGLSVAIPSAISIGTVMTESVSYPATALALYATAVALGAPNRVPAARRPRGGCRRIPHSAAVRGPLRDVDRGARHPLADRTMVETTDAGRPHPLLADGVAARAGDARLRREARVGRGRIELVRLLCGALAGLRPPRRRAMVRLPPRGLRRLPRHRSGRSRADRALGPRARREGGIPAGGRVRGAVRRRERHRTARGRRVREQPVGLRPAPRPLRVLPPPPLAHRPRSVARLRPASPAHRVDRSESSGRSRSR